MKTRWIIPCCLLLNLAGAPPLLVNGGTVFTVSPTGVDDTANLQAAFDAATAAGYYDCLVFEFHDAGHARLHVRSLARVV